MSDRQTLHFYEENAVSYAQHRRRPSGEKLTAFLAALPAGARILELGCGNGMDAEHMLAQGFEIDATDGTPALVAEAQKRIGNSARLMQFADLAAEAAYDGVWACASLLHVESALLPDILARVRRALRPSGVFVASFKAGTGEGRDSYGRYYNYPTASALKAAYRTAGWSDLTLETNMGGGFDALPTAWLWVTARQAG